MSSRPGLPNAAWIVMARGEPYELRDVDGAPLSAAEAKAIIAERYQVSEEVRRRRRSRKNAGKAPHQVLEAQIKSHARSADTRGDLPRATTPTPNTPSRQEQAVNATRDDRLTTSSSIGSQTCPFR